MAYTRYQPVPYRYWLRDDGRRASIWGAAPWTSAAERPRWTLTDGGWTIRDNHTNTEGLGRPPFATEQEAAAHCARLAAL